MQMSVSCNTFIWGICKDFPFTMYLYTLTRATCDWSSPKDQQPIRARGTVRSGVGSVLCSSALEREDLRGSAESTHSFVRGCSKAGSFLVIWFIRYKRSGRKFYSLETQFTSQEINFV